ncbi:MAG TPA: class I SAM-dependent methyltransferase [Candidatus Paceibacterota bacterium]|nr:class I SAM-dependent methyltransferase [Candidatus Paceibacterota bacterium]
MTHDKHLVTKGWEDYELLDSGENMKLERFGKIVVARPETQALWAKRAPERWSETSAEFAFSNGKGSWTVTEVKPPLPPLSRLNLDNGWEMSRGPLKFIARLSGFKHTGVFPEQEPNWIWIKDRVKALIAGGVEKPSVLNLFGYTGVATLAAAHAGAFVTHVDSSKQSLDYAHENARATGLAEGAIRWIPDDCLAFAKREARRGAKYEGIILDPPAFGRGGKGEVWKIEEDLPTLLAVLKELLGEAPGSFFLISGYAAGYSPRAFSQAVESAFGETAGESGELLIKESSTERVVPAGIYTRFVK